jgi:hypothetical protein
VELEKQVNQSSETEVDIGGDERTTSPVGMATIARSHFHQPRGNATARLLEDY